MDHLNATQNRWHKRRVRPSMSSVVLLIMTTTASLTVSLSHAKPVTFHFAWGNATATVDEKVTQVLSGTLMQYTWTYQIRLQQDGEAWVLSASAPVLTAEPTVVANDEKKLAETVDASLIDASTIDAKAGTEKITVPPHPVLPMPDVVIDASGNVVDFAATSENPTSVQPPTDVPTDNDLAQAEQSPQRLDQIRVFWCQWSCPWAGRALELNQMQQGAEGEDILRPLSLIDEGVTYQGPYKQGPQVAMYYQAMMPAKGTELAALIAQFPRYPQSIGSLYHPPTGPACPSDAHGQRLIQIDAVVSPQTLRPTSVKSVNTLEMAGPEGYTYKDVVTRDYQFTWSTP